MLLGDPVAESPKDNQHLNFLVIKKMPGDNNGSSCEEKISDDEEDEFDEKTEPYEILNMSKGATGDNEHI